MWISDLTLILPDQRVERGSIRIEDGLIAEIVEGPAPKPGFRARGLTLVPGLIDLHGDMLEREINPRPKATFPVEIGLAEVDKRLAANGVTTAFAAISFAWHKQDGIRSEDRAREIMGTVNRMRPVLLTDHYVHARFEITNPDAGAVLEELLHAGEIQLVSITDHTPGQGQYRDVERYVKFAIEWHKRQTGEDITADHVMAHIEASQARPKAWDAVAGIVPIAKSYGIPLASHDDDTAARVHYMVELGMTISEFPVTEEAAREAKARGVHVLMGAPNAFRGTSTTEGNLSALEAIEAGLVDILAADYYPTALLHAPFALADRGVMPLVDSIKLVTQHPAEAVGLHGRGTIAEGKRADLTLVETGTPHRVRGVLREGKPIYWDRHMADLADASNGRWAMPASAAASS